MSVYDLKLVIAADIAARIGPLLDARIFPDPATAPSSTAPRLSSCHWNNANAGKTSPRQLAKELYQRPLLICVVLPVYSNNLSLL